MINVFVFLVICIAKLLISRFSFVKQPPSVEITRGVFLSPETFPRKIFPKFFSNLPKRLFADFLARICDEGKGCLLPAHRGGGVPFFVGLLGFSLPLFLSFLTCSGSFSRCVPDWLPSLSVGGAGRWCWASRSGSFSRPLWASSLASGLIVQGWEYRGGSGLWKHLPTGQNGSK